VLRAPVSSRLGEGEHFEFISPWPPSLGPACYTQEEIAEREGMTQEGVRDLVRGLSDFGNLAENAKALASHLVDYQWPLFNVWKWQEKTPRGRSHQDTV